MRVNFQVNSDLVSMLFKAIEDGSVIINLNGHLKANSGIKPNIRRWLKHSLEELIFFHTKESDAKYFLDALKGEKKTDKWVPLHKSRLFECEECGEPIELEFNGKEIRCINPCPYPNGLIYEFELNVPSGKMVVANDLRKWWRVIGGYSVNNSGGCYKTTKKYAEVGMAHAFVGNTCPGVYRINNNKFYIGAGASGENAVKGSRRVGGICTDLWWYSIVDYDDFVRRKVDINKDYYDVVNCKPGIYRFKHLYHNVNQDSEKPQIYTKIEWICESDPIKHYEEAYNALDFTAGQIVKDFIKDDTSVDSIQRAANHVMCVLGNGYQYHKNGWLGDNPDLQIDAPSVKIPVFRKKYRWYPLCDMTNIVMASGKGYQDDDDDERCEYLNKSFVSLAFNILHCIVKYGVDDEDARTSKRTMRMAKMALKGFVKKYPKQVPNYVKTLLKTDN